MHNTQKYNTEELFDKAKKIIEEEDVIFIEEIVTKLPCSLRTFYQHIPGSSQKMQELKEMINVNKIEKKQGLRKKWYENDNATTQLALYRLLSIPQEHKLLNQSYVDHTTDGEKVGEVDLTKLSDKTLEELKKAKDENNS